MVTLYFTARVLGALAVFLGVCLLWVAVALLLACLWTLRVLGWVAGVAYGIWTARRSSARP